MAKEPKGSRASSERDPIVYWQRAMWVLLIAALLFKGKLIYVTLYAVLATYFLSRYILRRGFEALECTRRLNVDHVFLGESAEVTVEVKNPSWVPLVWVMVTDETDHDLNVVTAKRSVLSLAPRQQRSWTYRVIGRKRGMHGIGPLSIEAGDPFGIEVMRGRIQLRSSLVVYPRIHSLPHLGLPSKLPFGEVKTARHLFEDPSRTIGTRPYQPGDPLKRMHWKLSAHSGELQVKEFQPSIALETMLFLNLNDEDYGVHMFEYYAELAIEVAASVGYDLYQKRQNVGLLTNGTDPTAEEDRKLPPGARRRSERAIYLPPRKGGPGLMRTLEVLARVECKPGPDFVHMLGDGARKLNWGATLVIITPIDTDELIDMVFNLRRSGYNIVCIIVGPAINHPEFLHRPIESGINFYRVRSPSEIEAMGQSAG